MGQIKKSNIESTISSLKSYAGKLEKGKKIDKEGARDSLTSLLENKIKDLFVTDTNFFEYSENTIAVLEDLKSLLDDIIIPADGVVTYSTLNTSIKDAKKAVDNILDHINFVHEKIKVKEEKEKSPIIYYNSLKKINLNEYFEDDLIKEIECNPKVMTYDNKRRISRPMLLSIGKHININTSSKELELDIDDKLIPKSFDPKKDYPLELELDFSVPNKSHTSAKIYTKKIKIKIKQPVDSAKVLGEAFTSKETYQDALATRLDNFYNTNAEDIIKEYMLERINKAGGSLSDTQKDILVDHMYNDSGFLDGDTDNAYTAADFKIHMPEKVKDDSIGGDLGYKSALRNLLINPEQFNTKSKEVFLEKMRDKNKLSLSGHAMFKIDDNIINQQVNELIQEQASNSIGNITNGALPGLLGDFSNRHYRTIRHQNNHRTGYRGVFKRMLGVFKGKKRRKLTDISTNNYFSFMSGTTYNISDEANVAGKKINQNIKLDINSRNNISASIKVSGDETADFEFAGASSIYELISGILGNDQVGAVTKVYLVFNIYKQFFQKMQNLFGDQDIKILGETFEIQSKDKLIITENGGEKLFDESEFRNLESVDDLQGKIKFLAESFNLFMHVHNKNYIHGMTHKKQNKFKIGGERVGRILRKRRNADFNFKIEVEGVNISYEDRKFTVTYDGEEIKANNLETILSHKSLEGKQIQIMKAVYKEMLQTTANDPKAQKILEKKSGIGFVVKHNKTEYVVTTQGGTMRFGKIPAGFPRANIDKKTGILTSGMFTSIDENEILSNPELASTLIHSMKGYRRKWVRGVNYT